jgi:hypothetical protein
MRHRPNPRLRRAAVATAVSALALAAAGPARADETLELGSGVPIFTVADLGRPGATGGDLNVFSAAVTPAGRLVGVQTALRDGHGPVVQGGLAFDLPDGQIVIEGVSRLAPGPTGLVRGRAYTRAVVGGTGRYAGMRGQVTSTRLPDGTYDQDVRLLSPPAGGTLELTLFAAPPATTVLDHGDPGASPGDRTLVDSKILDASGTEVGVLLGTQTVMAIEDDERLVLAEATFRLRDGDIAIGGLSRHTADGRGNTIGVPQVRPVVGGTGAYRGATGTVTTIRHPDGRYEQRFSLTGISQQTTRTLRLLAAQGPTSQADVPPRGASLGDVNVFDAQVRRGRRAAGRVRGVQTTVALGAAGQTVSGQMTYQIRGRGSIVVGGLGLYPPGETSGTVRNVPIVRPVIGGTGEFLGTRGTVRIVRRADGRYAQRFSLVG